MIQQQINQLNVKAIRHDTQIFPIFTAANKAFKTLAR